LHSFSSSLEKQIDHSFLPLIVAPTFANRLIFFAKSSIAKKLRFQAATFERSSQIEQISEDAGLETTINGATRRHNWNQLYSGEIDIHRRPRWEPFRKHYGNYEQPGGNPSNCK
jgi:hypothetical protein